MDAPPKKKRKIEHPYTIIRNRKVKGQTHLMHRKDSIVPRVEMGPDCKCQRFQCFKYISRDTRERIFTQFYSDFSTKNEQDNHLTGLISLEPVATRRPRVTVLNVPVVDENHEFEEEEDNIEQEVVQKGVNPNSAYFVYKVRYQNNEFRVCHKTFLAIHGIKRSRVRRIQMSLLEEGASPKDKRGQHDNHPREMPPAVREMIERHIASLRKRQSHYSLRDNPNRYYLPKDVKSVSQLHQLFLEQNFINIPYESYRLIFNTFNIGFALPHSDTCATCDKFNHDMKATGAVEAVQVDVAARKKAHLELVDKFRSLKRKYTKQAQAKKISCLHSTLCKTCPFRISRRTMFSTAVGCGCISSVYTTLVITVPQCRCTMKPTAAKDQIM